MKTYNLTTKAKKMPTVHKPEVDHSKLHKLVSRYQSQNNQKEKKRRKTKKEKMQKCSTLYHVYVQKC
jgi:hypothetical protein